MTIRIPRIPWNIFVLALVGGFVIDVAVRVLVAARFGSWTLHEVIHEGTLASAIIPLPIVIAAAASFRAAQAYGPRSLRLVFPLSIAPHAYWTFRGEWGRLQALADQKWTAAALAPAFAWVYSVILVTAFASVGLFLSARRHRLRRARARRVREGGGDH